MLGTLNEPQPSPNVFSADMRSSFVRRRNATPRGWEYGLPSGELATAEQLAEFHRRKRRVASYQLLVALGLLPAAVWIGASYIPYPGFQLLYMIAVSIAFGLLLVLSTRSFRCPVCDMPFEDRRGVQRFALSRRGERRSTGDNRWCESCGTRFDVYREQSSRRKRTRPISTPHRETRTAVPESFSDGGVIGAFPTVDCLRA